MRVFPFHMKPGSSHSSALAYSHRKETHNLKMAYIVWNAPVMVLSHRAFAAVRSQRVARALFMKSDKRALTMRRGSVANQAAQSSTMLIACIMPIVCACMCYATVSEVMELSCVAHGHCGGGIAIAERALCSYSL